MKESEIEKKVREYAESKGCKYYKFTVPGRRGVPDRLVVSPFGVTGFLELKKPDGDIAPKQIRVCKRLKGMKVPVGIVDNVNDGIKFVDYVLRISLVNFNNSYTWYHDAVLDD